MNQFLFRIVGFLAISQVQRNYLTYWCWFLFEYCASIFLHCGIAACY